VEHPCPHCNSAVDDSSAFCPNCNSPQVRFFGSELSSGAISVKTGAETRIRVEHPFSVPGLTLPESTPTLNLRIAMRSALNAGAMAAVLSLIPGAFIMAIPLAGFLCVRLYSRRSRIGTPSPRTGFRLGSLAGLFGTLLFAMLITAGTVITHSENEIRDQLIQRVHLAQAQNPDPQVRQWLAYFETPEGLLLLMIFSGIFMCVIFVLLSGAGGAFSAFLLRRKDPPS